jgi:hypothetical protein
LFQSAVAPPLFALALANPRGATTFNQGKGRFLARRIHAPRPGKPPVAIGSAVMSASNSAPACRTRPATASLGLRPSQSAWARARNRAATFACLPATPNWINTAVEVHGPSRRLYRNVARESFRVKRFGMARHFGQLKDRTNAMQIAIPGVDLRKTNGSLVGRDDRNAVALNGGACGRRAPLA